MKSNIFKTYVKLKSEKEAIICLESTGLNKVQVYRL